MRIIITPRFSSKKTVVEIKKDTSPRDSTRTTVIGEAIFEDVCEFMNFVMDKDKNLLRVEFEDRQSVMDWLMNSSNRNSANESKEVLSWVISVLSTNKPLSDRDREEIINKCMVALARVSW